MPANRLRFMAHQLHVRLGSRIRDLRVQRGWSQEDLADVSGLHRTYVGSAERGERNLTVDSLQALAGAFGLTLSGLLKDLDKGLKTDRERALARLENRKAKVVRAYDNDKL